MSNREDLEIPRLLSYIAPFTEINCRLGEHITATNNGVEQLFVELPYEHKAQGVVWGHFPVAEPTETYISAENNNGLQNHIPIHNPFNFHNRRLPLIGAFVEETYDVIRANELPGDVRLDVQTKDPTIVSVIFPRRSIVSATGRMLLNFTIR